jgi:hypothetical protein
LTRIFEHGVGEGIHLRVEISPSSYVSHALFEKHVGVVLIPAIESNRNLPGCEKKSTSSFGEKCGAYCSDDVLTKLAQKRVIVTVYPPHIPRILQVLDVLLFGVLKRAKKYQRRDDSLASNVNHIRRLFERMRS